MEADGPRRRRRARRGQFGVDLDELKNPWHAAGASFAALTVGALLPLLAIVVPPVS
ncbi:MAG: hypothetical protein M3P95_13065 [Actinomycetota bacterium]|nr:hypothetical protein [Actinomycetota bacterium]